MDGRGESTTGRRVGRRVRSAEAHGQGRTARAYDPAPTHESDVAGPDRGDAEVIGMPSSNHSTIVPAPPEAVFAFIADGENARSWRPGVLDIKHVSGSGVGAAFAQGVRGPGGRRIAADYEITEFEPGKKLAFRATAVRCDRSVHTRLRRSPVARRSTSTCARSSAASRACCMGRSVQSTMDSRDCRDRPDRGRDERPATDDVAPAG